VRTNSWGDEGGSQLEHMVTRLFCSSFISQENLISICCFVDIKGFYLSQVLVAYAYNSTYLGS
jgi:hypothetical protein